MVVPRPQAPPVGDGPEVASVEVQRVGRLVIGVLDAVDDVLPQNEDLTGSDDDGLCFAERSVAIELREPAVSRRSGPARVGQARLDHPHGLRRLVRLGPTLDRLDLELWIVTHPVLRRTARVRALMTFLRDALLPKAELFAGKQPS